MCFRAVAAYEGCLEAYDGVVVVARGSCSRGRDGGNQGEGERQGGRELAGGSLSVRVCECVRAFSECVCVRSPALLSLPRRRPPRRVCALDLPPPSFVFADQFRRRVMTGGSRYMRVGDRGGHGGMRASIPARRSSSRPHLSCLLACGRVVGVVCLRERESGRVGRGRARY